MVKTAVLLGANKVGKTSVFNELTGKPMAVKYG
jgi:signal recognition particle receptor subunit beta